MKTLYTLLLAAFVAIQAQAQTVKIAYPNWPEGIAITYLAKALIEDELEYRVELTQAEPEAIFASLASGDQDVFLDAWLPYTHAAYWKQYYDQLERLGTVMPHGKTGLAVPAYVKVQDLYALNKLAPELGGKIIGIETDAGITRKTNTAIREYKLELTQSNTSTEAMITALDAAIQAEKPIVVTAWTPHWMFAKYDLRLLPDPQNVYQAEGLRKLARLGFSKEMPEVAHILNQFSLTESQLNELLLQIEESGKGAEAVTQAWLEAHPELRQQWTAKKSFWKRLF
ncbi:glycine betaine ABC transporter substrate-binding protein [Coraliomargarita parva]|uniref:glycine betaine ABC transporter substrate-binding protein n=1 Tax=Coraliomargarita parva TaxID=3014050 RepID=UPI0022B4F3B8|nr:glycine betaine ABC transporter substrate-binding protein [Coraliomargarita parva]